MLTQEERNNAWRLGQIAMNIFLLVMVLFMLVVMSGCNAEFTMFGVGNTSKHVSLDYHQTAYGDNGSNTLKQNLEDVEGKFSTEQQGEGKVQAGWNGSSNADGKGVAEAVQLIQTGLEKLTGKQQEQEQEVSNPEEGEQQEQNSEEPANEVTVIKEEANFHHINFASWEGRGTSIVFNNDTPKIKSVSIGGVKFKYHGNDPDDKGRSREVWTEPSYSKAGLDGLVVVEYENGKKYEWEVKSNGGMLYP